MPGLMLLAIDTNALAYAEGAGDATRHAQAVALMTRLPDVAVVLPVQVLGELYRVLVGKLRQPPAQAREAVLHWSDAYAVRARPGAPCNQPSIWRQRTACRSGPA